MTQNYRFKEGESLLEVLTQGSVIKESTANLIMGKSNLLLEAGDQHAFRIKKGSEVVSVPFTKFMSIFFNFRDYPEGVDITSALGFPSEAAGEPRSDIRAMTVHFLKERSEELYIPSLNDRKKLRSKFDLRTPDYQGYIDWFTHRDMIPWTLNGDNEAIPDRRDPKKVVNSSNNGVSEYPTEDDDFDAVVMGIDNDSVDDGRRRRPDPRQSNILKTINDKEFMMGDFYNDISRIPKPSQRNWLKFWKKDVASTGIAPEKAKWKLWKKIFVVGYQIEPRALYEIWFNTLDSTYTVHDYRGGEIAAARRFATMNEAVYAMIAATRRFARDDIEFFRNPANRTLADSFFRPLVQTTDSHMDDLARRERDELAAKQEAVEKAKQAAQDKERREQKERDAREAERQAMLKRLRTTAGSIVKQAGKSVADSFAQPKPEAQKRADEFAKRNQDNVDRFEKERKEIEARRQARQQTAEDRAQADMRSNQITDILTKFERSIKQVKRFDTITTMENQYRGMVTVPKGYTEQEVQDFTAQLELLASTKRAVIQDAIDAENARIAAEEAKAAKKPATRRRKNVTEAIDQFETDVDDDFFNDIANKKERLDIMYDNVSDRINEPSYQRDVEKMRAAAMKDKMTFDRLQQKINQDLERYESTRLDNGAKGIFDVAVDSDRREKITLGSRGIWNRIKQFLTGEAYRADFILGYSVGNRINFEVWYITEPNKEYDGKVDRRKTISSFYVIDATSKILVRKYVPYLRNALQVIQQKVLVAGR